MYVNPPLLAYLKHKPAVCMGPGFDVLILLSQHEYAVMLSHATHDGEL